MARPRGPNATVAWLRVKGRPEQVAGAAFLVASDLAVTCAHVVREHLSLGTPTPPEPPNAEVTLRFEALGREISATVATAGWWPDGAGAELDDIAVLHLDEPLAELDSAGLALSQPRPREQCYVYGAIGDYQGYGQTIYAQLAAQPHPRGWHQLNARPGEESGYFVKRGFSGSAVLDELGNTIWGMVVAVEMEPEKLVAFAVPAEDLRVATRKAVEAARREGQQISEPKLRPIDPLDNLGRDAVTELMAKLRQLVAQEPGRKAQVFQELNALAR